MGALMEQLIKIGSVTAASRARRALLEESLRTRLTKVEAKREGCVWGLKVKDEDLLAVTRGLRDLKIPYELS